MKERGREGAREKDSLHRREFRDREREREQTTYGILVKV